MKKVKYCFLFAAISHFFIIHFFSSLIQSFTLSFSLSIWSSCVCLYVWNPSALLLMLCRVLLTTAMEWSCIQFVFFLPTPIHVMSQKGASVGIIQCVFEHLKRSLGISHLFQLNFHFNQTCFCWYCYLLSILEIDETTFWCAIALKWKTLLQTNKQTK